MFSSLLLLFFSQAKFVSGVFPALIKTTFLFIDNGRNALNESFFAVLKKTTLIVSYQYSYPDKSNLFKTSIGVAS